MKKNLMILFASLLMLVSCGGGSGSNDITQSRQVTNISIETPDLEQSYPIGVNIPYAAVAFYNTGDKVLEDYTSNVQWSIESNSESSISISEDTRGLVQTNKVGTATIVAHDPSSGATSSQQITVYNSSLSKLSLNADLLAIPVGKQLQLNATGDYQEAQNSRSIPLNYSVNWTIASGASNVELVDPVHKPGLIQALSAGEATIVASFDGKMESMVITVTDNSVILESIELANPLGMINNKLAVGNINNFRTLGHYSDGSWYDLTNQTTWVGKDGDGRDSGILTTNNGLITTVSPGDVNLIATAAGKTITQPLQVATKVLVSIFVKPAIGDDVKAMVTHTGMAFKAYASYSDSTVVDITRSAAWSAESASIRMLNDINGLPGYAKAFTSSSGKEVTIEAKIAGQTGKYQVIVLDKAIDSLTVARNNLELIPGLQQQYFATGLLDNYILELTSSANWFVNPLAVGQFNLGVLTANQTFSGTIYATARGITSNSLRVNVSNKATESLVINPANFTNNTVAKLATIEFTAQLNFADSSQPFDLTNTPSILWTSDNPAVVRPTSIKGQFTTGAQAGTATITANFTNPVNHEGSTASFIVHVGNAIVNGITVSPNLKPNVIATGAKQLFSVTLIDSDRNTYKISHPLGVVNMSLDSTSANFASIDMTTGILTAGDTPQDNLGFVVGYALISQVSTPVAFNIVSAATLLRGITINQAESTIIESSVRNYTAVATYSNGSTKALIAPRDVHWSVIGESTVATIDSYGRLVAEGPGNVTVKAQLINNGQVESDAAAIVAQDLTVVAGDINADTLESIEITSADNSTESIAIHQQRAYRVIAHYKKHTDYNVDPEQIAWTSTNPQVATIDGLPHSDTFGVATGVSQGVTTITARFANESSQVALAVNSETITLGKITIVGSSTAILDSPISYKAYGDYYDNNGALISSQQLITNQVSWTTSNPAVAIFSSANKGVFTGSVVTVAKIYATLEGISESRNINIVAKSTIQNLVIRSNGSNVVNVGGTNQYTAKLMLNGAAPIDVTDDANWTTESLAIATINNANNKGQLTGRSIGSTNVIASYAGELGLIAVTVAATQNAESLVAVYLVSNNHRYTTSESLTIPLSERQQFSLMAKFADGSSRIIDSDKVVWLSSAPTNVSFTRGTAIALVSGSSAELSASYDNNGQIQSTPILTINVPADALTNLYINPHVESVPYKSSVTFSAKGIFGTESALLTTGVKWSSDNSGVTFADPTKGTAYVDDTVIDAKVVTITAQSIANPSIESTTTIIVYKTELASLVITPNPVKLESIGDSKALTVQATYANGMTAIIDSDYLEWTSSESDIVAVDQFGTVTALANSGTSTVTAIYQNESAEVIVKISSVPIVDSVTGFSISPNPIRIYALDTTVEANATLYTTNGQIKAGSDSNMEWSVADNNVATITSGANRSDPVIVKGSQAGTSYINVNYNDNIESVELDVYNYTLDHIQIVQLESLVMTTNESLANNFRVIAYFKNGANWYQQVIARNDPSLSWSSPTSVTIDKDNIVAGANAGSVDIEASYKGSTAHRGISIVAAANRTVDSLSFAPMFESVAPNTQICYVVTAGYSDGSSNNVSQKATIDIPTSVATRANTSCMTSNGLTGILYDVESITTAPIAVNVTYGTIPTIGKLSVTPIVGDRGNLSIEAVNNIQVQFGSYLHKGTHTGFKVVDAMGNDLTNQVTWLNNESQYLTVGANGVAYVKAAPPTVTDASVTASYGSSTIQPFDLSLDIAEQPTIATLHTYDDYSQGSSALSLDIGSHARFIVTLEYPSSDNQTVDPLQDITIIPNQAEVLKLNPLTGLLLAESEESLPVSGYFTFNVTSTDGTYHIESANSNLFKTLPSVAFVSTDWELSNNGTTLGATDSLSLDTAGKFSIKAHTMGNSYISATYDVTWFGSVCDNNVDCGIYVVPSGIDAGQYYVYGTAGGTAHITTMLPSGAIYTRSVIIVAP